MPDPDYFTLEELAELPNMTEGRYTEARKLAAAAYVTRIIEREVGTSFVPRTVVDTLDGSGSGALVLSRPYVRALTAVTVGGTTVDVAGLTVRHGVVRHLSGGGVFTAGDRNVVVTYTAGYSDDPDDPDAAPADIKEAAMQATRWRLLATNSNSDMNARQTSSTNDVGGTVQYSVAGKDRPTGYPEVDAVIVGWREKLDGFGFA